MTNGRSAASARVLLFVLNYEFLDRILFDFIEQLHNAAASLFLSFVSIPRFLAGWMYKRIAIRSICSNGDGHAPHGIYGFSSHADQEPKKQKGLFSLVVVVFKPTSLISIAIPPEPHIGAYMYI